MDNGTIKVSVTLIRNGEGQLLLVYNPDWGAYTLPMTKVRGGGGPEAAKDEETWQNAAARNVVECLGRPSRPAEVLTAPVAESRFSPRRQVTRAYLFQVFEERLTGDDRVVVTTPYVWATPQQILQWEILPLTHTAHDLVAFDEIVKIL